VTFARGVSSLLRQTDFIEGILDRAGAARSLELKEGSTAAELLLFEMVEADFVMTWLLGPLQRMLCALGGHDSVFCFERDRLSLRCLSCGYRTSGWRLDSGAAYSSLPVDGRPPSPPGNLARPLVISGPISASATGSAFAHRPSR